MLVRSLGLRPYAEVWDLQRKLVYERGEGAVPDTLLLCEHPPVYTRGVSSKQEVPQGLPHPVFDVERGGDLTWHGPGQLVGYPIVSLSERGIMPRSFLRDIEEILIEALSPMLKAERIKGFTGLWVGGRKLVSIGIAVQGGVSFHGFALNVNCELADFARIHPCKLEPGQMTSLQLLLGRAVNENEVLKLVATAFLQCYPDLPATTALPANR